MDEKQLETLKERNTLIEKVDSAKELAEIIALAMLASIAMRLALKFGLYTAGENWLFGAVAIIYILLRLYLWLMM